jgi:hypothetical protein
MRGGHCRAARAWVAVSLLALLCALPASASAHAGSSAPAATSFVARLGSLPGGLRARVVDGDQRLWLHPAAGVTAIVLGFVGEPYLRFSGAGVAVNTRSPAYYLNRQRPLVVPPGLGPHTPPRWQKVTSSKSYSWHEDRLHSLAAAARAPGSAYVGRWTIPIVVGGRRTAISGGLWHVGDPPRVWFWPIVVLLACLPALTRLRRVRLDAALLAGLAFVTLAGSTAARLARDLYGRPTVSSWQLVGATLTCVVAVALGGLALRASSRRVGFGLIGLAGIYEGLALIATLVHGFVLAALPAALERTLTVAALAGGAGLLLMLWLTGDETSGAEEADADRRPRAGAHTASPPPAPT